MKICVAQTRAIKGDIPANINNHKKILDLAIDNRVDFIVFPELSLTGYEPELAKALATDQDDSRFDDFQRISDTRQITIGVGMPTKNDLGICISMILFQPGRERQTYSKRYIHEDEEPFFVCGQSDLGLVGSKSNISLAICYELSVPRHSEDAFNTGAEIYIASVAKPASGVEKASRTLSEIGSKYSMTVLMSNGVGPGDNFENAGKSAVWNNKGLLLGQLDDVSEGILILDTETQDLTQMTI